MAPTDINRSCDPSEPEKPLSAVPLGSPSAADLLQFPHAFSRLALCPEPPSSASLCPTTNNNNNNARGLDAMFSMNNTAIPEQELSSRGDLKRGRVDYETTKNIVAKTTPFSVKKRRRSPQYLSIRTAINTAGNHQLTPESPLDSYPGGLFLPKDEDGDEDMVDFVAMSQTSLSNEGEEEGHWKKKQFDAAAAALPSPVSEKGGMEVDFLSTEGVGCEELGSGNGNTAGVSRGEEGRGNGVVTRKNLKMGFQAGCEKCRAKVPGHWMHF